MILLISISFLYTFPFLYLFFPFIPLSFLSTVLYIISILILIYQRFYQTIFILFLKLQHYTLTFLHLVLFSLYISIFPYSISYSPLPFLYAFPSYFLTFPTHCLAVPKLILLYLVISYYHFDYKHYIMLSYCALLCHNCQSFCY